MWRRKRRAGHGGRGAGYGSVAHHALGYGITIVGSGNFFDLAPTYVALLMPALEG